MERQTRGMGSFWVPLLIIMILVMFFMRDAMNQTPVYTNQQFEQALEQEQVRSVTVEQSATVPTGTLSIVLNDGSVVELAVSNVNTA